MFLEGVDEDEGTQLPGVSRHHPIVRVTRRLPQASLPFGQEGLRACLRYKVSFSPKLPTLGELKEPTCFDFSMSAGESPETAGAEVHCLISLGW